VLRRHARSMQWQPEAATMTDAAPDIGLQPLRGGHRPASRPLADTPAQKK